MMDLLSFENTLFASFVFHASLNLAKMLAMGPLTSLCRLRWKVMQTSYEIYSCFSVLTRHFCRCFQTQKTAGHLGVQKSNLNSIIQ